MVAIGIPLNEYKKSLRAAAQKRKQVLETVGSLEDRMSKLDDKVKGILRTQSEWVSP